ncbi:MAG: hypothetical protein ABIH86_06330 [Planctomycetota bacterium]
MAEVVRKREKKEVDKNIGALIAQDVMDATLDKRKNIVEKRLTESREFRLSFHSYAGIVLFIVTLLLMFISLKRANTTKQNIDAQISVYDDLNKETDNINASILESKKKFSELSIQNTETLIEITSQSNELSTKKASLELSSSVKPQTADDFSFIISEYCKRIRSDSVTDILLSGSKSANPNIRNLSHLVTKSLVAFCVGDQIISIGMVYEPNRILTSYNNLAPYYSFTAYRFNLYGKEKDTYLMELIPQTPKIIAIDPQTGLAIVDLNLMVPMIPISVTEESKYNFKRCYVIDKIERINKIVKFRFASTSVSTKEDCCFFNKINDSLFLGSPCITMTLTFAGMVGKSESINNRTFITRPSDIEAFAALKSEYISLNYFSRYHFIDKGTKESLKSSFTDLKLVSSVQLLPEILDITLCNNGLLLLSNKNSVKLSVIDPETLKETAGIETNIDPICIKSNGNYIFTMTDTGIARSIGDYTNGGTLNFEKNSNIVCFDPISIKYAVYYDRNGTINYVIYKTSRNVLSFKLLALNHRIDFARSAVFGTRLILICYDSKQKALYLYNQPISDLVKVVNSHERILDKDSQEKVTQAKETIANTKLFQNQKKLNEIAPCDIDCIALVKSNRNIFIGNAVYEWDKNGFMRSLDFSKKKNSAANAETSNIVDFALSATADGRFVATSTYIYDTQTDQIVTMFPYITPKAFFTADGKHIILYNLEKNALELREIQLPQTP